MKKQLLLLIACLALCAAEARAQKVGFCVAYDPANWTEAGSPNIRLVGDCGRLEVVYAPVSSETEKRLERDQTFDLTGACVGVSFEGLGDRAARGGVGVGVLGSATVRYANLGAASSGNWQMWVSTVSDTYHANSNVIEKARICHDDTGGDDAIVFESYNGSAWEERRRQARGSLTLTGARGFLFFFSSAATADGDVMWLTDYYEDVPPLRP